MLTPLGRKVCHTLLLPRVYLLGTCTLRVMTDGAVLPSAPHYSNISSDPWQEVCDHTCERLSSTVSFSHFIAMTLIHHRDDIYPPSRWSLHFTAKIHIHHRDSTAFWQYPISENALQSCAVIKPSFKMARWLGRVQECLRLACCIFSIRFAEQKLGGASENRK